MNSLCFGSIKIIGGNSHPELTAEIANILGLDLVKTEIDVFKDGESSVRINESVRGCDVFVIQSTSNPVNHNLMELLIIIDALKRASAGRINAVIPYYGYARQDRKARARDPISAKLVANILTTAGADRVITMDLHCPQIQGFFDIPVDHLVGMPKFKEYYLKRFTNAEDIVVVSPDLGSNNRTRHLADYLHASVAIVDKKRDKANESKVMHLIGDVKGKNAIMLDDMIDTGGSIINAVNAIKEAGAKSICVACTHGVFSDNALEKLQKSDITELIALNTIEQEKDVEKKYDKIKFISVADEFADAIKRIHDGRPVSDMFDSISERYN